jgi:hypothetical protein
MSFMTTIFGLVSKVAIATVTRFISPKEVVVNIAMDPQLFVQANLKKLNLKFHFSKRYLVIGRQHEGLLPSTNFHPSQYNLQSFTEEDFSLESLIGNFIAHADLTADTASSVFAFFMLSSKHSSKVEGPNIPPLDSKAITNEAIKNINFFKANPYTSKLILFACLHSAQLALAICVLQQYANLIMTMM